jgi:hypothetical protein
MSSPHVTDAALEAASENDRSWFEANPGRAYRVRPQILGEWPAGALNRLPQGQIWYTVVHQVSPGVRMRLPILLEAEPEPGERAASHLFASATEQGIEGEGLSA